MVEQKPITQCTLQSLFCMSSDYRTCSSRNYTWQIALQILELGVKLTAPVWVHHWVLGSGIDWRATSTCSHTLHGKWARRRCSWIASCVRDNFSIPWLPFIALKCTNLSTTKSIVNGLQMYFMTVLSCFRTQFWLCWYSQHQNICILTVYVYIISKFVNLCSI